MIFEQTFATLDQVLRHARNEIALDPWMGKAFPCGCKGDASPCDAAILAEQAPHAGYACPNFDPRSRDIDHVLDAAEAEWQAAQDAKAEAEEQAKLDAAKEAEQQDGK
jgi:hypothetical protein